MKRKVYKPTKNMHGATLTHMREVVFGNKACVELYQQAERSDRMRNDAALLDAAEQKRKRKAEKRAKNVGKCV